MKRVNLSLLADVLEETFDGWKQFYNTHTGEVESLPDADNDYTETEDFEELAEKIDSSPDYVQMPSQWDIHEYQIMEAFAEEIESDILFRMLRGRKPFRHFKDKINELGIDKEYYRFRYQAFYETCRNWCDENNIPYCDDQK